MSDLQSRTRTFSWRDPAQTAKAAGSMTGMEFLQGVVRGDFRAPI